MMTVAVAAVAAAVATTVVAEEEATTRIQALRVTSAGRSSTH